MPVRDEIVFYLNGKRHTVEPRHAGTMLTDYLRQERGLVGTKIVCAEGDCGACTVLRHEPRSEGDEPQYLPVNSCIAPVAQMDGSSIVTIDSLHDGNLLTPVQQAMVVSHASQCGFCTPGFVMALTGLVEKKLCSKSCTPITSQEAKNALTGNLCRCTGYQPIIDASVAVPLDQCAPISTRFFSREQKADLDLIRKTPLHVSVGAFTFFAPTSAAEASQILATHPDVIVAGSATDLGVVHNKRHRRLSKVLSLHLIPELTAIKRKSASRIVVGARVTLSELRRFVKEPIPEFARFLDLFASPQIKNVATLVGNVANASPIGDTPPFLLVTGATIEVLSAQGKRSIPISEFFLAYRKTALRSGEWITSISFDVPDPGESLALYKASQRKDLDISAVSVAFRASWEDDTKTKLGRIQIAMGGVAATPIRLTQTEAALAGKLVTPVTLQHALNTLLSEITPLSDVRGTAGFRRVLAENLMRRFFRVECGVLA